MLKMKPEKGKNSAYGLIYTRPTPTIETTEQWDIDNLSML